MLQADFCFLADSFSLCYITSSFQWSQDCFPPMSSSLISTVHCTVRQQSLSTSMSQSKIEWFQSVQYSLYTSCWNTVATFQLNSAEFTYNLCSPLHAVIQHKKIKQKQPQTGKGKKKVVHRGRGSSGVPLTQEMRLVSSRRQTLKNRKNASSPFDVFLGWDINPDGNNRPLWTIKNRISA